VSISPTFYKQLFHTKVPCATFLCLQFGFVIFWQKSTDSKAAHKKVGEIDPRSQFYHPFMNNFLPLSLHKNKCTETKFIENLRIKFLYKKAACTYNVGEIDYSCQLQQHFMSTFFSK